MWKKPEAYEQYVRANVCNWNIFLTSRFTNYLKITDVFGLKYAFKTKFYLLSSCIEVYKYLVPYKRWNSRILTHQRKRGQNGLNYLKASCGTGGPITFKSNNKTCLQEIFDRWILFVGRHIAVSKWDRWRFLFTNSIDVWRKVQKYSPEFAVSKMEIEREQVTVKV